MKTLQTRLDGFRRTVETLRSSGYCVGPGGRKVEDSFNSGLIDARPVDYESKLPPTRLLLLALGLLAASLAMFAFDSRIGYGLAVIVMVVNTLTSTIDQRLRADFNYVLFDWFRPLLVFARVATSLVASGHVLLLAIESAR